jgi:hypothetical protein
MSTPAGQRQPITHTPNSEPGPDWRRQAITAVTACRPRPPAGQLITDCYRAFGTTRPRSRRSGQRGGRCGFQPTNAGLISMTGPA